MLPTLSSLQAECKKIHYFGLGFIQVKVSDILRYHFYTSKLQATNEDPHTHRYEFKSEVLKGVLTNVVYAICNGDEYERMRVSCDPAVKLNDQTTEFVGAYSTVRTRMAVGSVYLQRPEVFHTVKGYEAITRVQRPSDAMYPFAEILKHRSRPKVCPFSTVVPEAELWAVVKEMLGE